MKKYSIIYADPPWAYRTYSKKGQGRSAESHYPTMCIEDIKALPVGELAAKDCALFLWITFPCLCEALEVLTARGFCMGEAKPKERRSLYRHGLLDKGECRNLHPCNKGTSEAS